MGGASFTSFMGCSVHSRKGASFSYLMVCNVQRRMENGFYETWWVRKNEVPKMVTSKISKRMGIFYLKDYSRAEWTFFIFSYTSTA